MKYNVLSTYGHPDLKTVGYRTE